MDRLTVDLAALDQANAAAQKSRAVAPAQKLFDAAVTQAVHALAGTSPAPVPVPPIVTPTPPGTVLPPQGKLTDHPGAYWIRDNLNSGINVGNLHVHTDNDYGLAVMGYFPDPPVNTVAIVLHDIISELIGTSPTHSDGTAEAGIWLGAAKMQVDRVIAQGTWEGIWTGCNFSNSTVRNFTAAKRGANGVYDQPLGAVGLYLEHVSKGNLFENGLLMGRSNSEWWYSGQGSSNNTFRNVTFYCAQGDVGSFEDAGTFGNVYDGCTFIGPGSDAVGLSNNALGPKSVVLPNCVLNGKRVYFHDNSVGAATTARALQSVQPARKLHPHTLRMPSPANVRLAAIPR